MNIGFYRYSIYNRGGDRIIVDYANHLVDSGHQVTMYTRHIRSEFNLSSKVHTCLIPYPGKVGALLYGSTHKLNHDVIIIDIIQLSLLLSLRNSVLYFAQADDREYYHNTLLRMIISQLYAIYFRSGQRIISVSQHLADIFARDYDFHNSKTVRNGINHAIFYPEQDRDLIFQKKGKKAVVFMSRGDAYRKGLDIAMQVFRSIDKKAASQMELWVCGNHLDDSLYTFTTRNMGVVSDSRLRQILSSADILFYPSRHEGFGLFPLEAMACGCVVITTDAIPYARQTSSIITSPIGDFSDLKNKLVMLLNNNATYHKLKKDVFRESQEYDLNKSKMEFEQALNVIVTSRGSRN